MPAVGTKARSVRLPRAWDGALVALATRRGLAGPSEALRAIVGEALESAGLLPEGEALAPAALAADLARREERAQALLKEWRGLVPCRIVTHPDTSAYVVAIEGERGGRPERLAIRWRRNGAYLSREDVARGELVHVPVAGWLERGGSHVLDGFTLAASPELLAAARFAARCAHLSKPVSGRGRASPDIPRRRPVSTPAELAARRARHGAIREAIAWLEAWRTSGRARRALPARYASGSAALLVLEGEALGRDTPGGFTFEPDELGHWWLRFAVGPDRAAWLVRTLDWVRDGGDNEFGDGPAGILGAIFPARLDALARAQ